MVEQIAEFTWDSDELAKAMIINEAEVDAYFTDGRKISFLIESRLVKLLNGTQSPSEGSPYDIEDGVGCFWESRSITKHGTYFCPSVNVGAGRKFNEDSFLDKLSILDGYILSDITQFPVVPIFKVDVNIVLDWYCDGMLGTTTSVSRKKMLNLIGQSLT